MTKFTPVYGEDEKIQNYGNQPGNLYFATDTGKIYLDTEEKNKIVLGNSGVTLIYGSAEAKQVEGTTDEYTLPYNEEAIEDYLNCRINDLILNSDGCFYRIDTIDKANGTINCIRLSVSGSGSSGGPGLAYATSADIKKVINMGQYINGQKVEISVTTHAAKNAEGIAQDDDLTIKLQLTQDGETLPYESWQEPSVDGQTKIIDLQPYLRENVTSNLQIQIEGINGGVSKKYTTGLSFEMCSMTLSENYDFNPLSLIKDTVYTTKFSIPYIVGGSSKLKKIATLYVDGQPYATEPAANATRDYFIDIGNKEFSVNMSDLTHGTHKFAIKLSQYNEATKEAGLSTDLITYELAIVKAGNEDYPIIWFGNYKDTYYSYDKIQIPYMVYDPKSTDGNATLMITSVANVENTSTLEINYNNYNNENKWAYFEIIDPIIDADNKYYFECGKTTTVISVHVAKDENRSMELVQQDNLLINFSAAGRSNDESSVQRIQDKSGATFTDFNWYNNGWKLDKENNTCLRISNGAKFSIPLDRIAINGTAAGEQACTFEFEFKVRNIQDYSNLVKEITRYKYTTVANDTSDNPQYSFDTDFWAAYQAQQGYNSIEAFLADNPSNNLSQIYSNYDAFLKDYLAANDMDDIYERLEYNRVEKILDISSAICSFYDGTAGLCLGPQDGFFTNGTNTVNIKYVEDKMINLSVVFEKNTDGDESGKPGLILMYINGILTSVAKNSAQSAIIIQPKDENNKPTGIVFNSKFCDIDLYKCRVYRTALDVKNICLNYAVDKRDVLIYDETTILSPIVDANSKEHVIDYEAMLQFNRDNPDNYIIPYMVVSTNPDGKNSSNLLPYSKSVTIPVNIKFVNTGLDRAYKKGILNTLANKMTEAQKAAAAEAGLSNVEYYYYHHCPSFSSKGSDFTVQGTSSEFYPRRNYKLKTQLKSYTVQYKKDENGQNTGEIEKYKSKKTYTMKIDGGPFEEKPREEEKNFYMDNDYVGTNKFTLKIDYMESSGSYNVGLGNLVDGAYNKHPLEDYAGLLGLDNPQEYYDQLRTNVKGFPILMFHEYLDAEGNSTRVQYIGRYNMLLDKGSDDCYGFKAEGDQVFVKDENGESLALEDAVECWEYSDNARTFCSFRDPLGRKEFSFSYPDEDGNEKLNSVGSCPIVADSFEYRYNPDDDMFDYIYYPSDWTKKKGEKEVERLRFTYSKEHGGDLGDIDNQDDRNAWVFKKMKNWEKACAWVWSTCIDHVPALGTYDAIDLAAAKYEPDIYYVIDEIKSDEENNTIYTYKQAEGAFNKETVYYVVSKGKYEVIKLTDNENLVYEPSKYYYKQGSAYLLAEESAYDISKQYYALNKDENLSDEYLLPEAKTYGSMTYYYDTKEYRLAKFKYEFTEHFDKHYSLIYFVVTEVLMCYDSRGKNCMMASWGPQKAGGDYIWYPIFYDMDTQLGINNTGIPSFDYYVNAHEEGCFSTNDSVLWQNIYTCFFDDIKSTYTNLRDLGGILDDVEKVDATYRCDPSVNTSYAAKGEKPLMAINLDEWYKYITITNSQSEGYQGKNTNGNNQHMYDKSCTYFYALQGDRSLSRIQFLTKRFNFIDGWLNYGSYSRSSGNAIYGRCSANDPTGTSDIWVDEGGTTGGHNLSISAYYTGNVDDNGNPIKTNYLDADTYVELTPYQHSYVTIGGDNEALPSVECEKDSIRYTVPMANSLRTSPMYAEQLLYIYGAEYLQSIGDSSLMYWREFYAPNAPKLKNLLLGNDYPGFYNKVLKYPTVAASKQDTGGGKPLLEEVNFTNVQFRQDEGTAADFVFNFDSCEKLKVFKACGSNLSQVTFADGVALTTLYLPENITSLKLTEARKLTHIITNASIVAPTKENYATWVAPEGLYIAGLTDGSSTSTNINTFELVGGSLGYDSYKLLERLYDIKYSLPNTSLKLSLTDVDWCPYSLIEEGYEFSKTEANAGKYFMANEHFQLLPLTADYIKNYNETQWNLDIANQILYVKKDNSEGYQDIVGDKLITILKNIASSAKFFDVTGSNVPNITGTIYINNVTQQIEEEFSEQIQKLYPKIRFFLSNVKTAYSAKFVRANEDGTYTQIGTSEKLSADSVIGTDWFRNPYELYSPETNEALKKATYDFVGWSYNGQLIANIYVNPSEYDGGSADPAYISMIQTLQDEAKVAWDELGKTALQVGVNDYKFEAVFEKHRYKITFYNEDGTFLEHQYKTVDDNLDVPVNTPYKDDSNLQPEYMTYKLLGYSQSLNSTSYITPADLLKTGVTGNASYYAVFDTQTIDIRNLIYPEYFTAVNVGTTGYSDNEGQSFSMQISGKDETFDIPASQGCTLRLARKVTGKITIPLTYNGYKVVAIEGFGLTDSNGIRPEEEMYGEKITHVFFQLDENEMTNVRKINHSCFRGLESDSNNLNSYGGRSQLKHIEFAKGIRVIGQYAFAHASNLILNKIDGTVWAIDKNAFDFACKAMIETTDNTLFISDSVYYLGNYSLSFYGSKQHSLSKRPAFRFIYMGSAENLSNIDLNPITNQSSSLSRIVVMARGYGTNMVIDDNLKIKIFFYTNKYTEEDRAKLQGLDTNINSLAPFIYGHTELEILNS